MTVNMLNMLRVVELTSKHLAILLGEVSKDAVNEFTIEKALRIYPMNYQHNEKVLQYFEERGTVIHTIKA